MYKILKLENLYSHINASVIILYYEHLFIIFNINYYS